MEYALYLVRSICLQLIIFFPASLTAQHKAATAKLQVERAKIQNSKIKPLNITLRVCFPGIISTIASNYSPFELNICFYSIEQFFQ